MKNKKRIFVIFLIIVLLCYIILKSQSKDEYQKSIQTFDIVDISDIDNKVKKGQNFILYIGRETCPECRVFAPILSEVAKDNNLKVLYLDSTDTEKTKNLKDFRDKYNILYVPSLLISKGGNLYTPEIPESKDELEKILSSYGF